MNQQGTSQRNAPRHRAARHFLHIPGPTNVPERVLRAIDSATIDHRGPAFKQLAIELLERLKPLFQTVGPVCVFPGSGTGAWEAALVNTLSPGDQVLMFDNGYFASQWHALAGKLGLDPVLLKGDWRHPPDADLLEATLREDREESIRAVCVVHNETSTGVVAPIPKIRSAIDAAGHPALFMIDTVSSIACSPYFHDDWGVDVTIASSQKGLMLPPGLSFNAIGKRALAAREHAALPRSYWDWEPIIAANDAGAFPYTPATNLLYGLREALDMLDEEGLENVFARHARHAAATRAAVAAWGLETWCNDPESHSHTVTAVAVPDGFDADEIRQLILERYDMSLGSGLGALAGRVFRIGHLGDLNDLTLCGALAGVELGLKLASVPHREGGINAAMARLSEDEGGRLPERD